MLFASFVSIDFIGFFFPNTYTIKQNETKNESLWDPTGIDPLSDNYCDVLPAG